MRCQAFVGERRERLTLLAFLFGMEMDYREAFKTLLREDTQLAALLPGGVFDRDDREGDFGGASQIPRDSNGVQQFAVIHWAASNGFSAPSLGAERQSCEVYLYARKGFAGIERAAGRIKVLTHRVYLKADDRAISFMEFTYKSPEFLDESMGNLASQFVRITHYFIRA